MDAVNFLNAWVTAMIIPKTADDIPPIILSRARRPARLRCRGRPHGKSTAERFWHDGFRQQKKDGSMPSLPSPCAKKRQGVAVVSPGITWSSSPLPQVTLIAPCSKAIE